MSPTDARIVVETITTADPDAENMIRRGLSQYNREQVGSREVTRLTVVARNDDGEVVGGLLGESIWSCLLIETLWVADGYRHQHYGETLLAQAEALKRGCQYVVLETFSFQALSFYQKQGYSVYGQIDDFPPGHTRYSLKKNLALVPVTDTLYQYSMDNLMGVTALAPPNSIDLLYQIMIDLLNRHNEMDVLQTIVEKAALLLDAPYGAIMLVDGDELVVKAFIDNQPDLLGDRVNRGQAFVSWRAFDTRQPILIDNYFAWSGKRVIYDGAQLQAVADFPILLGDTCLGVLAMGRTQIDAPFTKQQVTLGLQFAQLVAVVLDNIHSHNTTLQEIAERKQAEQDNQAFLLDMKALQELHLELGKIEDLNTLYKQIVVLGQQHLGVDRIGLFLLSPDEKKLLGSYGIDVAGAIRDERYFSEAIDEDHWTLGILANPKHVRFWADAPIYDNEQIVGTGWKAAAALWNGHHAVGYLIWDTFLSRKAPRPYEVELISIVGSMFGHLIERKQDEERILRQNQDLVKANYEIAVARKQAEAANKLKSQFLATMSHELRTPLNAIIGYAQLCAAGMVGEMTEQQVNFQERILANGQHLLQLINTVLDISKIEAGRLEMVEKLFDLQAFFSEIKMQTQRLATSKQIAYSISIDPQLPQKVMADNARLKQIIINLVSNAIKFTDTGAVNVAVTRVNAAAWRILVTDTGVGIPSHMLQTIFDEFRQGDAGIHRGGTGLGLAIVRNLTLMVGGTIQVQSKVGQGSTFILNLPLVEEVGHSQIADTTKA